MRTIYDRIVNAENGAGRDEARAGWLHIVSLVASKTGDAVVNPKLTLSWLLASLGAPASLIGLAAPIREAGALIPQLALTRLLDRMGRGKTLWALGASAQGASAPAMAAAALTFEANGAVVAILGALVVFALGRAACSVSFKGVLARTIPKARRGAITGAATSAAAAVGLGFGGALAVGWIPMRVDAVAWAVLIAGGLWCAAAAAMVLQDEPKREREDEGADAALGFSGALFDSQFRIFLGARCLLVATAIAPPFILIAFGRANDAGLGALGPVLLTSSAAAIVSGYVWGRVSDHSSRDAMLLGAIASALILGGAGVLATFGVMETPLAAPSAVFLAQLAYEGVRRGRKTHLTDMSGDGDRARRTAVANTVTGLALAVSGLVGLLADAFGAGVALLALSGACALAAALLTRLEQAQN